MDMFLFEAQDKRDLAPVVQVMTSLDNYALKQNAQDIGFITIRNKIRDHSIWKTETIWRARLEAIACSDQGEGGLFPTLLRCLREMVDFRVPIEVVDNLIAEELSRDPQELSR